MGSSCIKQNSFFGPVCMARRTGVSGAGYLISSLKENLTGSSCTLKCRGKQVRGLPAYLVHRFSIYFSIVKIFFYLFKPVEVFCNGISVPVNGERVSGPKLTASTNSENQL